MKILILEGIATSGKTTIENLFEKYFVKNNITYKIIDEIETLMPQIENKDKNIAIEMLKRIFSKYTIETVDYLIFDRLHLTHTFRTNSEIKDFREIEEKLKEFNSKIIFLKIKEEVIKKRIFNAMEHRNEKWIQGVRSKGSDKEIVEYYINQQRKLIKHLEKTKLEYKTFNTTNSDFKKIFRKISKFISS